MRRRIAVIMAFLILGAIVNVAVAWGCAAWITSDVPGESMWRCLNEDVIHKAIRWEGRGVTAYSRTWLRNVESKDDPPSCEELAVTVHAFLPLSPSLQFVSGESDFDYYWTETRGLPLRSLWSRTWGPHWGENQTAVEATVTHGIELGLPYWGFAMPRVLPLGVIWPGFIFNTLFYAAILWLLFAGSFTARRMIRRRRGLCEKCAYPIGVSPVCTECGAAVRASVVSRTE